jgi:hypothetical protein
MGKRPIAGNTRAIKRDGSAVSAQPGGFGAGTTPSRRPPKKPKNKKKRKNSFQKKPAGGFYQGPPDFKNKFKG